MNRIQIRNIYRVIISAVIFSVLLTCSALAAGKEKITVKDKIVSDLSSEETAISREYGNPVFQCTDPASSLTEAEYPDMAFLFSEDKKTKSIRSTVSRIFDMKYNSCSVNGFADKLGAKLTDRYVYEGVSDDSFGHIGKTIAVFEDSDYRYLVELKNGEIDGNSMARIETKQ